MSASPFQSPRSSRPRQAALVLALVAVGVAARNGDSQPAQPAAKAASTQPAPPAAAPASADSMVQPDSMALDSMATDSLTDSTMAMMVDSMAMTTAAPEAAAAPAPTTWPIDPVTGQTLINGRPVVGRVFIMQKMDGTVKYPNVADVVAHEAMAPLPPVVGTSYTPAPLANQRRHRGMMVQATLWSMDNKRSATRLRHYPVSTPANELAR